MLFDLPLHLGIPLALERQTTQMLFHNHSLCSADTCWTSCAEADSDSELVLLLAAPSPESTSIMLEEALPVRLSSFSALIRRLFPDQDYPGQAKGAPLECGHGVLSSLT